MAIRFSGFSAPTFSARPQCQQSQAGVSANLLPSSPRFSGETGVDKQTLEAYEGDQGLFERLDDFDISKAGDLSSLPEAFPVVETWAGEEKPAVLDIGCGTSTYMRWLNGRGYDSYGIDPWQSGISQAKAKYPDLAEKLKVGALPSLGNPFNRKFDKILCTATLMHLPNKSLLEPSIAAMKKLLKPNGTVYVSISQAGRNINELGRDEKGRLFTHFSNEQLIRAFDQQGFELVNTSRNIDSRNIDWGNFEFRLKSDWQG